MNPQELRVCNLVLINNPKERPDDVGKIAIVLAINSLKSFQELRGSATIKRIDDKWGDTYSQWLKHLQPIPITEEWLLKFGFELDSCSKYFERWRKDVVYIEKINGNYHHDYVAVGAVHTLQNLYFALTGEEISFEL